MPTLPQSDTATDSRSVRIRGDIWEAARTEAFLKKISIVSVLDVALRAYFNLEAAKRRAEEN